MKTSSIDLSRLSREEKLKLAEIIAEKKRRQKESRPLYAPHKGQLEVHCSPALARFVFSGNGSGKTAMGVNELKWAIEGYNPITKAHSAVPCRAFVILDKPDKVETVLLPEIRKWSNIKPEQCHKRGKPYYSFFTFPNGSTLTPLFWDQEPMTAEGIEGDFFWFDEPCPRPLYISLRRAGRTKGRPPRYLLTGTPISAPWLRTEVYEPWAKNELADVECFRFGTEMNKANLLEGYIEQFSAALSEKERRIRLEGEFFDLEGLALSHVFRRATHTLPRSKLMWERDNPCVVVMDPHPSKAHVAVVMGCDRDGYLMVLDEYKEKAIARKFTESLIERGWFESYRVLDIVYDSLGSGETTSGEGFKPFGVVVNEVLQAHGIGRARATSYSEKSDEDFIERIQDSLALPQEDNNFGLRPPKLRLVDDCRGSIADIENVQWAKDKRLDENKPKLEIGNRDFLACIKYGLACNLSFNKRKNKAYYVKQKAYGIDLSVGRQREIRKVIKMGGRPGRSRPTTDDDF